MKSVIFNNYEEWFENLLRVEEHSMKRKDAFLKVSNVNDTILEHLIKIIYWDSEQDYNKHARDIDSWLKRIQKIKLKSTNKSPTQSQYYEWM